MFSQSSAIRVTIMVIAGTLLSFLINELAGFFEWDLPFIAGSFIIVLLAVIVINLRIHEASNSQPTPISINSSPAYQADCGTRPLRLEGLSLEITFGSYFADLLEREETYFEIPGQINYPDSSDSLEQLSNFQKIIQQFISRHGAEIVIIAAEGGMGKSTLAARIIRCLHESREIDKILGDSAKLETIDIQSGTRTPEEPGFTNKKTFYSRLVQQLGPDEQSAAKVSDVGFIKDILASTDKTVIVLDNFETVEEADNLLKSLEPLVSSRIRAIITTRQRPAVSVKAKTLVISLNPLTTIDSMREFINWHIQAYKAQIPNLSLLEKDIKKENIKSLIRVSGGIPLVIQLVLSDVVRNSWDIIQSFPHVPPVELLEYLYGEKWKILQQSGKQGEIAIDILQYLTDKQIAGENVRLKGIVRAMIARAETDISEQGVIDSINLLHEHFLIQNQSIQKSSFSLVPSLVAWVNAQK